MDEMFGIETFLLHLAFGGVNMRFYMFSMFFSFSFYAMSVPPSRRGTQGGFKSVPVGKES